METFQLTHPGHRRAGSNTKTISGYYGDVHDLNHAEELQFDCTPTSIIGVDGHTARRSDIMDGILTICYFCVQLLSKVQCLALEHKAYEDAGHVPFPSSARLPGKIYIHSAESLCVSLQRMDYYQMSMVSALGNLQDGKVASYDFL